MLKKYISMDEFLMGRTKLEDLSDEFVVNANTTVTKVNQLLEKFGEYRKCNSGYRSIEDQKRINPKSMKSNHLKCLAIDLDDDDGKLAKFCKNNIKIAEELGLYYEDFSKTIGWVHAQIVPPKSKKRIFMP